MSNNGPYLMKYSTDELVELTDLLAAELDMYRGGPPETLGLYPLLTKNLQALRSGGDLGKLERARCVTTHPEYVEEAP